MPNVHRLRTPLYREMVKIVKGAEITSEAYKFAPDELKRKMHECKFSGKTRISRFMLV